MKPNHFRLKLNRHIYIYIYIVWEPLKLAASLPFGFSTIFVALVSDSEPLVQLAWALVIVYITTLASFQKKLFLPMPAMESYPHSPFFSSLAPSWHSKHELHHLLCSG